MIILGWRLQMSEVSKSPDRYTFQKDGYIKRCVEEGREPSADYINMYETFREQDDAKIEDPQWQKNNLEYDLRSTDWILEKVRNSESYAQHLYAAMCNNDFIRNDVWPILKGETWGCSWRSAGGIVANMRQKGDYIDWYCSGIGNQDDGYGLSGHNADDYVPESVVTDEIRQDLLKLGWVVVDSDSAY